MTVRELIDQVHTRLLSSYAHVNEKTITKDVHGKDVVTEVTAKQSEWQREAVADDAEAISELAASHAAAILSGQ